jgi:hypothetical protein
MLRGDEAVLRGDKIAVRADPITLTLVRFGPSTSPAQRERFFLRYA